MRLLLLIGLTCGGCTGLSPNDYWSASGSQTNYRGSLQGDIGARSFAEEGALVQVQQTSTTMVFTTARAEGGGVGLTVVAFSNPHLLHAGLQQTFVVDPSAINAEVAQRTEAPPSSGELRPLAYSIHQTVDDELLVTAQGCSGPVHMVDAENGMWEFDAVAEEVALVVTEAEDADDLHIEYVATVRDVEDRVETVAGAFEVDIDH